MKEENHDQLVSFIWNIANDVMVNTYNKGDYRKIILPMMVIRRLDAVLDAVLAMKKNLDGFSENVQDITSKFEFRNQIDKLSDGRILGMLIEKFADPRVNLSTLPI